MARNPSRPALARGLLAALWLPLASVGCGDGATRDTLNVVLVVLDTVRADRLDCSGSAGAATPNIDALCDRGIRFERASSTSSWTLPAHASLFTGLHPIEHGATQEHTVLDRPHETLAEILWARGYHTIGVSANPVVSVRSGLARGFDRFAETWRDRPARFTTDPAAHPNNRAVMELLAEVDPDERFFLFVNYIEAHGPYTPPEPYRSEALGAAAGSPLLAHAAEKNAASYYLDPSSIAPEEFALQAALYDGEVAYLDSLVGGLLDALEASGRLDDTLVILTSDHGENLGEHGHFRHVFSLYGTTVHVPLLLLLPGDARAGEVVAEPVSLIDVFATVLAAAGSPPDGRRGRNLLAGPRGDERAVIAEYYYPLQALGLFGTDAATQHADALAPYLRRLRSIERDGLRLIWSSAGGVELFNLAEDPDESRDLAGAAWLGERQRRLLGELDAFVAAAGGERPLPDAAAGDAAPVGVFEELDAESAEQLRELGYLPR